MSKVAEFHRAFGLPAPDYPPLDSDPVMIRMRMRLITEEYKEVQAELAKVADPSRNPSEAPARYRALLKELCDLQYVVEGTAVSLGLPLAEAYAVVHASNMSKLGGDGRALRRGDGKVLKGPSYVEADLTSLIPDIIESEES